MNFDFSWDALTRPELGGGHFQFDVSAPFEVCERFSLATALWLSEISRAVYKTERGGCRPAILEQAGLVECSAVQMTSTQAALIRPRDKADAFTVLAFQGTCEIEDWMKNLDVDMIRWSRMGRVHYGFAQALDEVWGDIEPLLATLPAPLYITGHSLGGALAVLAAARLRTAVAGVYTFGAPRPGDDRFAAALQDIPVYRIVNHADPVPTLPPPTMIYPYVHAGRMLYITRNHQLLEQPDEDAYLYDRDCPAEPLAEVTARKWYDPPATLSDHASVNYSAKLEWIIQQNARAGISSSADGHSTEAFRE